MNYFADICFSFIFCSNIESFFTGISLLQGYQYDKSIRITVLIFVEIRTFKNRDLLLQTRSQFSKHALGEMIEAYEKIISKVQEDDLAVTGCTLRKIRQLMEEIK